MAEIKGIPPVDPILRPDINSKQLETPERKLRATNQKPNNPLDEPMPQGDPGTYQPDGTLTPPTPKRRSYN